MSLKLYASPACPFSHRVCWAAKEKALVLEYVEIPIGPSKPEWFKQVNPRGTVPVLTVGEHVIFESSIIVEYLEEAFPTGGVPLYPKDPLLRSQVRYFVESFICLGKAMASCLFRTAPDICEAEKEKWRACIVEKIRPLTGLLTLYQSRGPYFLGDQFSMAEIATIPFLDRFALALKQWHGLDVFESDRTGRFKTWFLAATSRPAYQATTRAPQYLLDSLKYVREHCQIPMSR
eukprot:TRINITY_DN1612_c0_g1_i1.p1 TRINITY_DN1612_c0_g1~~TRINITY_DN1612_c0_g1_i1.p1  ORF type:complete len:233 (+),score=32.77 TRINITY_DN1612_c0_g1_i1:129-827(+)